MKKLALLFIGCCFALASAAQSELGLLISEPLDTTLNALTAGKNNNHTSLRPFIPFFDKEVSSYKNFNQDSAKFFFRPFIYGNALAGFKNEPEFGFAGTGEAQVSFLSAYKEKLTIHGGFLYASMLPPNYLQNWMDSIGVFPGVGELLTSGDVRSGYNWTGGIGLKLNQYFHVEVGKGKHFWGDGYRSLILSHNAAPYPYARITSKFWKVKYVNLYALLDQPGFGATNDQGKKYLSSHAISWNATKRLNISLFESVVWQQTDTLNNRGVDWNYLNPIIFYRPLEFALGSADNVILGAGWRFRQSNRLTVYGQIVFDEFLLDQLRAREGWWGNKFATQIGFTLRDVVIQGLSAQFEGNLARPYTYTHGSVKQNYGHFNQSLVHPLGTNFVEGIFRLKYQHPKFSISNSWLWAIYGRDKNLENYGGDVFRSYAGPRRQFGNYLAQGLKSTLHVNELRLAIPLNTNIPLFFETKYLFRFEKNDYLTQVDHWFQVGIRMNLTERYNDF